MKTRSKALYAYLLQSGVLDGTAEAIALAKGEYRRLYKKHWKQQQKPRKEIRFEVTLRQFAIIRTKAAELDIPHTTYARRIVLAGQGSANKETLLQVLQILGMAAIAAAKGTISMQQLSEQLEQAENMLLNYIRT